MDLRRASRGAVSGAVLSPGQPEDGPNANAPVTRLASTVVVLDAYTVVFGFGLHDERTYSPNEFYRLSSFRKAQTTYASLLEDLAPAQ
jgi:hypothetical protein